MSYTNWKMIWEKFPHYWCTPETESSQSSHKKPPKSPLGGILPNLFTKSCQASNSVWKIGITSFIRITQSKIRLIENMAFLVILEIFEMALLWTAWSELSLWYQFSTQNLMPSKFHLIGLAKFRQVAILAGFCGYFLWLLPRGWVNNVATYAILFLHGYVTFCRIL